MRAFSSSCSALSGASALAPAEACPVESPALPIVADAVSAAPSARASSERALCEGVGAACGTSEAVCVGRVAALDTVPVVEMRDGSADVFFVFF